MNSGLRVILITVIAVVALVGLVLWLLPSHVDNLLVDMEAADVAPLAQGDKTLAADAAPFPTDDLACRATAYAPVLASVYVGGNHAHSGLAATVSIRNISERDAFALTRVDYYDSNGARLQSHLDTPVKVGPLKTVEFFVDVIDREGGSGANFVVGWASDADVPAPLIETVMVGGIGAKGISIVSRAVEMERSCR